MQLRTVNYELRTQIQKENLRGRRKMHRDVLAARETRDEYVVERIPKTEAARS